MSKPLTIMGNVCIGASFVSVGWMVVEMVIRWRGYNPDSVMDTIPLRTQEGLIVVGYLFLASIFAITGIILRRKATKQT